MYKQFACTRLLTTCAWCLRRPEEGIISPKTVVIDTVAAMLVLGIKLKNYRRPASAPMCGDTHFFSPWAVFYRWGLNKL